MSNTALTRLVYARLDELSTAADLDARLEFLCHGLLPNSGNPQTALLWAVLDGIALDGKHILDAGCGRGGASGQAAKQDGLAHKQRGSEKRTGQSGRT